MSVGEASPLQNAGKPSPQFSNTLTTVFSCIGLAVGTGNIWRFPRIVAQSSGPGGALVFLLVWVLYLLLWSIPMLFIEYATGRFTKRAVVQAYHYLLGIKFLWASLFMACVQFFISCYYTVIMGWSLFYIYDLIAHPLPENYEASIDRFYSFTEGGWPVLTQFISLLLSALATVKGVRTIERANTFLTPCFLLIIVVLWIWSLTRENAWRGIYFLFTPDWSTIKNPTVWVEGISQNAFDTGAGSGSFIAYSTYIPQTENIAKYAVGIPLCNNLVSLLCGMTSFSTVFSAMFTANPNITNSEVLDILQTSGPGGTGITFIWYPVLFSAAGTLGRVLGVFFYIGLFFAGLSSNIPGIENSCRNLIDLGVRRAIALPLLTFLIFIGGLGSALDLSYLDSQDFTWGFALVLTGLLLQMLVILYGTKVFREKLINGMSPNDWNIPRVWEWIIKFIGPIEAILVIVWWIVSNIIYGDSHGNKWYEWTPQSVITVVMQWVLLVVALLIFNLIIFKLQPKTLIQRLDEGKFDKLEEEADDVPTADADSDHIMLTDPTNESDK